MATPSLAQKYSSHLPVLCAAANVIVARVVTELGCGNFSTSCFLNKDYFPDLLKLRSYEADRKWIKKIKKRLKDDRWSIIHCSSSNNPKIRQSDIILVDGSSSHRSFVLSKMNNLATIYVVHDTNVEKYSKLVNAFAYHITFIPHVQGLPYTSVASNVANVHEMEWNVDWDGF